MVCEFRMTNGTAADTGSKAVSLVAITAVGMPTGFVQTEESCMATDTRGCIRRPNVIRMAPHTVSVTERFRLGEHISVTDAAVFAVGFKAVRGMAERTIFLYGTAQSPPGFAMAYAAGYFLT